MAGSNVAGMVSSIPAPNLIVGSSVRSRGHRANVCNGHHRGTETMVGMKTSRSHHWERNPVITFSPRHMRSELQATHSKVDYGSKQESSRTTVDSSEFSELSQIPIQDQTLTEHAEFTSAAPNSHPFEDLHIGQRWREIQGEQDWDGLLDPMNPVLRGELIRYGEFAQATYDAFDYDTYSRFCGSCKFRKEHFMKRLSLKNRGYEVIEYMYSTSDMNLPKFFKKSDAPKDEMWSKNSNWIGFVAVCTSPKEIARLGRRDILVAWRGTVTNFEWIEDIKTSQCPTGVDPRRVGKGSSSSVDLKVELGFLSLYKSRNKKSRFNKASAGEQVLGALRRVIDKYQGEELSITVTGHSLGGALATLCAYDIAESGVNTYQRSSISGESSERNHVGQSIAGTAAGLNERIHVGSAVKNQQGQVPITAYTFAAPRVGNNAFRDRVVELGVKVLRVVNVHDIVPCVPGLLFNEKLKYMNMHIPQLRKFFLVKLVLDMLELMPATYAHVGMVLQVDNLQSPFLKQSLSLMSAHNLEAYLHLLDGFQGTKSGSCNPKFYGGRDLALVNKGTNLLKAEHMIPPSWVQKENKGLVRTEDGRLVLQSRDPEDFPEAPLWHHDDRDLEIHKDNLRPIETHKKDMPGYVYASSRIGEASSETS